MLQNKMRKKYMGKGGVEVSRAGSWVGADSEVASLMNKQAFFKMESTFDYREKLELSCLVALTITVP